MPARPVVLLTPDLDTRDTHRGPVSYLQIQRYYTDCILEVGGLPLVPPPVHHLDDAEEVARDLVGRVDALVISGGGHDIDPALYGEARRPACGPASPERTHFELLLLRAADERRLPVLGICGGLQLLNVARGGTLYQDLPTERPGPLEHTMQGPKNRACHDVDVVAGSRLQGIVNTTRLGVNSTHHQAIKRVGERLIVSAHADDGLIEAIEDPDHPFYVGVQWHPEAIEAPAHRAIYRALLQAVQSRRDGPPRRANA